eukprot:5194571-Amphidinium_carterae.2
MEVRCQHTTSPTQPRQHPPTLYIHENERWLKSVCGEFSCRLWTSPTSGSLKSFALAFECQLKGGESAASPLYASVMARLSMENGTQTCRTPSTSIKRLPLYGSIDCKSEQKNFREMTADKMLWALKSGASSNITFTFSSDCHFCVLPESLQRDAIYETAFFSPLSKTVRYNVPQTRHNSNADA